MLISRVSDGSSTGLACGEDPQGNEPRSVMAGPRSSPLLLCVLVASTLLLNLGAAAPGDVVYDQRQSGSYNVHLRVQDVGIFAVLGRSSNSVGINFFNLFLSCTDSTSQSTVSTSPGYFSRFLPSTILFSAAFYKTFLFLRKCVLLFFNNSH